jgi:hypothetical protein
MMCLVYVSLPALSLLVSHLLSTAWTPLSNAVSDFAVHSDSLFVSVAYDHFLYVSEYMSELKKLSVYHDEALIDREKKWSYKGYDVIFELPLAKYWEIAYDGTYYNPVTKVRSKDHPEVWEEFNGTYRRVNITTSPSIWTQVSRLFNSPPDSEEPSVVYLDSSENYAASVHTETGTPYYWKKSMKKPTWTHPNVWEAIVDPETGYEFYQKATIVPYSMVQRDFTAWTLQVAILSFLAIVLCVLSAAMADLRIFSLFFSLSNSGI